MNIDSKNRSGSAGGTSLRGGVEERPAPLPTAYEDAWFQLLRASAELMARVEGDLKESAGGMTLAEFDVLNALMRVKDGKLPVSKLTESTRLSRSAVTRLVDRMAATKGYVQKKQGRDGREVVTAITPAGRTAMQATLRPAWERAVRVNFADFLTEKNARVLADFLASIVRGGTDETNENTP